MADYIIENRLWEDYSVRYFDYNTGFPIGKKNKSKYYCGAGRMRAVDCNGSIFPCIRFLELCMTDNSVPSYRIGDIYNGMEEERLRVFEHLSIMAIDDEECSQCSVASGCLTCAGNNYCYSESHSVFERVKFICKMQKAQARVNEYFWDRLAELTCEVTPYEKAKFNTFNSENWDLDGAKYLHFILDCEAPPYCNYTTKTIEEEMSQATFDKGMSFAKKTHMIPVFVGNPDGYLRGADKYKVHVRIDWQEKFENECDNPIEFRIPVTTCEKTNAHYSKTYQIGVLLVNRGSISCLSKTIKDISHLFSRINIIKTDVLSWTDSDVEDYKAELKTIRDKLDNSIYGISIFDDALSGGTMSACKAGISEYALAPDGKFYLCPAYYFANEFNVGDLHTGIHNVFESQLEKRVYNECENCNAKNCLQCSFERYVNNMTVCIPCTSQCIIAKAEIESIKELLS